MFTGVNYILAVYAQTFEYGGELLYQYHRHKRGGSVAVVACGQNFHQRKSHPILCAPITTSWISVRAFLAFCRSRLLGFRIDLSDISLIDTRISNPHHAHHLGRQGRSFPRVGPRVRLWTLSLNSTDLAAVTPRRSLMSCVSNLVGWLGNSCRA